jgi:hypothetical protein
MSTPWKGNPAAREEMENFFRRRLEAAAEVYKNATDPRKRIEAMLAYAEARKELSNFIQEPAPQEQKPEEQSPEEKKEGQSG